MSRSKFIRCAILSVLLLMLLISPKLASGAMLEPADNVAVQCDYFWEEIHILNQPGMVEVSLSVYNISAENPTQQLKLTVASFSGNADEIKVNAVDPLYENGISVSYIESHPSKLDDLEFYRHEFSLIFDPPISTRERTIYISYTTNGSKWDNDLVNMILYVEVWSPKIVPRENSVVYVEGEGEGLKFNIVYEPWENVTYHTNRQGFSFKINSAALISNPYNRYIEWG